MSVAYSDNLVNDVAGANSNGQPDLVEIAPRDGEMVAKHSY
jgi:hypothetical protein